MAVTQSRDNRTIIAGADLSGSQFLFAKLDSAAEAVLCANGDGTIGVIEVGAASGNACTITHSGKVMVKCGGTVTLAGDVGIDANGKAVDAASTDIIVGRAYEAGVTDQVIAIELILAANAKA
jgi:hypothetical protein|tara:strand:- start:2163 stop:2531 length:369 start_codon:yes stop_codon:yes gene_type:complete